MSPLMTRINQVDALSADERAQLLDYLRRLPPVPLAPRERIFDLHPHAMEMSADFTTELPDSFSFANP
jgi:hypothetical protein